MQSWNHFLLQHLKQYGKEKTVTDDWDKLQRDLRWKCFWSQTFVSFARAAKLIYKNRSESLLSLAVCDMYVICIEPSAATHFFRKMAQWLKWSGSAQGSTRIIYTVWFNPHWNLAILLRMHHHQWWFANHHAFVVDDTENPSKLRAQNAWPVANVFYERLTRIEIKHRVLYLCPKFHNVTDMAGIPA